MMLHKKVREMEEGDVVKVVATDPSTTESSKLLLCVTNVFKSFLETVSEMTRFDSPAVWVELEAAPLQERTIRNSEVNKPGSKIFRKIA